MEDYKQKIRARKIYSFFVYYSALLTGSLLFIDWPIHICMAFALTTSLVFVFLLPVPVWSKKNKIG